MILSGWTHIIRSVDSNPNSYTEYIRVVDLTDIIKDDILYIKKTFSEPKSSVRGEKNVWTYKVEPLREYSLSRTGTANSKELAMLHADIIASNFGYKLYRPFFFN